MRAVHHWVTHVPCILRCYRYSGRGLTPLGDPQVCHVYYGAIQCRYSGRGLYAPLGDPRVCHVYYGAIGVLWERAMRALHHWVTHRYATYTMVL